MPTTIHLLGRPRIERDGVDGGRPRGRKAWAILAYVATAERPVSRERLAGMLFGEANDPLGALRWSLAEARRLIGVDGCLTGEQLGLDLPPDWAVDVRILARASWAEAAALPDLGATLLEGMSFPANPAFDAWLASERHHLAARAAGALRRATLARLAAGAAAEAVSAARQLLVHEPLDERAHALLVRALMASGDRAGAEAHVDACTALLTRELGLAPTEAVAAELEAVPTPTRAAGGATARALLDAGVAAVAAGATDQGLARLRDAAASSHAAADLEGEVRALCELGYALVHAVRGRDEAGAANLLRAVALAEAAARPELAATAHRELGYIDFLAARYDEAFRHLDDAEQLTAAGDADHAAIAAIRGACLTEIARYGAADVELARATDAARTSESPRWLVWAQTMSGRAHLLRGNTVDARRCVEEAIEISQRIGWASVLAWPEALLAEVELIDGRIEVATDAAAHAFALGCELRDPCWEATAGRVLGLIAAAEGRPDDALSILTDSRTRGSRAPDSWQFAYAQILESLAALATTADRTLRYIVDLELVAGRGGMREMLARAQLHRDTLGQLGARDTARVLAEGIDNPALTRLLTR